MCAEHDVTKEKGRGHVLNWDIIFPFPGYQFASSAGWFFTTELLVCWVTATQRFINFPDISMDPTMDFRNYHRWGWDEISSANELLIQSLSWICVQSLNCVTRSLFLCLGFSPQGKFRCVIHWSSHQILSTFQSARHWTSPLSFLSSASAFNVSFLIIMLCCRCWWIIKLNPPPSTCFDDVELHIPSRFAYKTIFPFVLRHPSHSAQLSSAASSRSSE